MEIVKWVEIQKFLGTRSALGSRTRRTSNRGPRSGPCVALFVADDGLSLGRASGAVCWTLSRSRPPQPASTETVIAAGHSGDALSLNRAHLTCCLAITQQLGSPEVSWRWRRHKGVPWCRVSRTQVKRKAERILQSKVEDKRNCPGG